MAEIGSFIPTELSDLSPRELLEHYDDPKNFSLPDNITLVAELWEDSFPHNTTILLTHGLFSLNADDRNTVVAQVEETKQSSSDILTKRKKANRLLKNFSDFWTRRVVRNMFTLAWSDWYEKNEEDQYDYPESVIIPKNPRIIWDPARSLDADDFVRETDFNGNELLPEGYLESSLIWEGNHESYHSNISSRLWEVEGAIGWSITYDIHDTGVNMMWIDPSEDTFREWGYPPMEIGTLDGDSCNPEILEYFSEQVERYFGFKPVVNQKYKWWYVTQRHGRTHREELSKSWENPKKRNVIQIELGRYLYLKESTQSIDHEQAQKVWAALRMCIQKTGEKFWEEYFSSLD